MTTSDSIYQELQSNLEQEHLMLSKDLKHEMQLNTLVPSALAIENADLNNLIMMAKSAFIPNLFDLAIRMEKVDAAVCSIKLGMYGLCVDCEEEIDESELKADPAQPRCHACCDHSRYHHD
ncbi:TraR/DksA C4-type zinc finger protein [Photobacterium profundum]|uniref:Hypothetical dksA-type zinc finger protein n=1 Tax=Photobacterium profundum (strain SS9) TaxID=298386 RepID=Q6LTF1_PHOPR|nr:TraR/DksA C4-type zinc finger protein [Photobacterium profundum]CAG19425.1 hypothetical dksA-type zinc finger protein [Photobacterium profundum SS9]